RIGREAEYHGYDNSFHGKRIVVNHLVHRESAPADDANFLGGSDTEEPEAATRGHATSTARIDRAAEQFHNRQRVRGEPDAALGARHADRHEYAYAVRNVEELEDEPRSLRGAAVVDTRTRRSETVLHLGQAGEEGRRAQRLECRGEAFRQPHGNGRGGRW